MCRLRHSHSAEAPRGPINQTWRHSCSGSKTATLLVCILLAKCALIHAAGTAAVSAASGDMSLLDALKDPEIQHIVIMQPVYNVRPEFEVYQGRPLAVERNISVTGSEGLATILDFDFVASAVQLCPTCTLTFSNITIANVRHGTGEAVDFVVGSKGSAVLFLNSNRLRLACTEAKDAVAVISQEPRSEILPGASIKQQLQIADGQFQSTVFRNSLHLLDVTLDVPHETVEGWQGGSGGYALGEINVTRLCYQTVDPACLAKASPDSCVIDLMDEKRGAAATAGQGSGNSNTGVAIGVSVASAVGIAAAIAGIVVCMRRRRARKQQQQQPGKRQPAGSRSAHGSNSKKPFGDVEDQYEEGSEDDLAELAEPAAIDVEALRMFDSFIEGCNFVRAPLGVRKGWDVSKVLTTPLINPGDDKNIQLGDFLGAGSFGRVYKAKFAGQDVAVKIIEHNSEASEAVESEVSLMLKFNHPNVVRAFYSITYTQALNVGGTSAAGNAATTGTGSTTSNTGVLREVSSGLGINSSAGSSSYRLGIANGSSGGGRYAQARSRGLVLPQQQQQPQPQQPQEVVIEGSSAFGGSANAAAAVSTPEARLPPRYKPGNSIGATAAAHLESSCSSTAATDKDFGSAASVAGSNIASARSQLGSSSAANDTDTVSRVYSWMGGSNPLLLLPPLGLQPPAPPAAPGKERRAETWLVQEYCDLGTLGSIVAGWQASEECDERMLQRLLLLKDAATGIKVLHSMNTVHGDLTARNVLVCSSKDAPYGMVAKLADLGLSRIVKSHNTHRTTNTVGTLSHAAPELLRYGHCSTSVDIYAFGVMMWELYTNKAAFNKLQYGQFYETVVLRNLRPILPPGMPADYSLLMQHCWASDSVQRPNVDRVLHCLGLMISERQERLSAPTAASHTQSAPLPQIKLHPRYSMDAARHLSANDSAGCRDCDPRAMPDGTVRHRSFPGFGSASGPRLSQNAAAAAAVAAAAAAAAAKAAVGDDGDDDTGGWAGPPSRFSWGERGSIGCATPSVPLRPLRQYVSDDYGTEMAKEESWFV